VTATGQPYQNIEQSQSKVCAEVVDVLDSRAYEIVHVFSADSHQDREEHQFCLSNVLIRVVLSLKVVGKSHILMSLEFSEPVSLADTFEVV
jgi:hypothetical protein